MAGGSYPPDTSQLESRWLVWPSGQGSRSIQPSIPRTELQRHTHRSPDSASTVEDPAFSAAKLTRMEPPASGSAAVRIGLRWSGQRGTPPTEIP
jgi:hypothetical protein